MSVQAESVSVASIRASDLVDFKENPKEIRKLIENALSLTRKKLPYKFGGTSPKSGGMDCSGTVQYTLASAGVSSVPRMSHTIFDWAKKTGKLHQLSGIYSLEHSAFENLKPGDLLFWEGTYTTAERDPPISHVMIYLGRLKKDGQHVIYGASSGRRYRGKKIHGVSVFDFKLPSKDSKAKFVAYGPVPGL